MVSFSLPISITPPPLFSPSLHPGSLPELVHVSRLCQQLFIPSIYVAKEIIVTVQHHIQIFVVNLSIDVSPKTYMVTRLVTK